MARKAKKLEELSRIVDVIDVDDYEKMDVVVLKELAEELSEISDPRDEAYVRHKLVDIIMITLFAVLANANEWVEIEIFGKKKRKWLQTFLELPYGIPVDDTFRAVISKININYVYGIIIRFLMKALDAVVNELKNDDEKIEREIISCDGKISNSSKRNETDKPGVKALNTLNAYSSDKGICIGQEFIEDKTNEIPALPRLLRVLDLKNTIVTWDALNTQKETVRVVIEKKGDYVGALKGNHGNLYADVRDYFDESTRKEIREKDKERKEKKYKKQVDKEHSAVVTREYYLETEIDWLYEKDRWSGLKAIGLERKKIEKHGKETEPIYEERYYISSIKSIYEFARSVRGHWGVENGLHWHLDYTFKDDKNTTQKGNGAEGLQIFKKIALALLKIAQAVYPKRTSLKIIRYRLSLDYENEIKRIFTALDLESVKKSLLQTS